MNLTQYKSIFIRKTSAWASHMISKITKYHEMMDVFNCTKYNRLNEFCITLVDMFGTLN